MIPRGSATFTKIRREPAADTPTGKLEFYSEALAENFPDDKERPPIPKWIEKSAMHDERRSSHRAKCSPCC
jgi:hypothetical protein